MGRLRSGDVVSATRVDGRSPNVFRSADQEPRARSAMLPIGLISPPRRRPTGRLYSGGDPLRYGQVNALCSRTGSSGARTGDFVAGSPQHATRTTVDGARTTVSVNSTTVPAMLPVAFVASPSQLVHHERVPASDGHHIHRVDSPFVASRAIYATRYRPSNADMLHLIACTIQDITHRALSGAHRDLVVAYRRRFAADYRESDVSLLLGGSSIRGRSSGRGGHVARPTFTEARRRVRKQAEGIFVADRPVFVTSQAVPQGRPRVSVASEGGPRERDGGADDQRVLPVDGAGSAPVLPLPEDLHPGLTPSMGRSAGRYRTKVLWM